MLRPHSGDLTLATLAFSDFTRPVRADSIEQLADIRTKSSNVIDLVNLIINLLSRPPPRFKLNGSKLPKL